MATFNRVGQRAAALYRNLISDPTLQLLLMMNETSGGIIYDHCTRNRLNGTVNGNPTYSQTFDLPGFYGLSLDGTGDYIDLGSAFNYDRTDHFSALALIHGISSAGTLLSHHDGSTGWEFSIDSSAHLVVKLTKTATTNELVATGTVALGAAVTMLVGFSYDGSAGVSGITLYKDGATTPDTDTTNNLTSSILVSANAQNGARAGANTHTGKVGLLAVFKGIEREPYTGAAVSKVTSDFRRWAWLAGIL